MVDLENIWKEIRVNKRFVVMAGPCVIESEDLCLSVGTKVKAICDEIGALYVFKASFDKANRTSSKSYRGPGPEEGLEILGRIRETLNVPVVTDVHSEEQAEQAGEIVDVIQIPAFLCRQTDLVLAAVRTGKIVNVKKGQFLSPHEMGQVVQKAEIGGGSKIMLTERGTTFGYNNLVADMRSIPTMSKFGYPVIFDATHSVQQPGAGGDKSGGQSEFAPVLASAAVAVGADGVFIETHPNPSKALSDGPNMVPLNEIGDLLKKLMRIREAINA
ncbi:3-deoxy-8-phosphooctulonate synthase [Verrucomicrobia bacterium]|nr:3-deoxy-8-phosphooctulonate synthase [Verrucomicrobiota bacterium]